MISKRYYFRIVWRVISIVLTSLLFVYLGFEKHYFALGLVALVLLLQTYGLIRFLNITNRKMAYFFEAVKNEDFALRFPEQTGDKSLDALNSSLNLLNLKIQEIHMQKDAQEKYYQEILRQAEIGILSFNKEGHIRFANREMEKLLNYHPLIHINQLSQVDEKLHQIFKDLRPFDRKTVQLTNERERSELTLKVQPVNFEGEALLMVVAQDIHRELDEKQTESWIRLIRVLTHEIMNTITPITSISDTLLKYFKSFKEEDQPVSFDAAKLHQTTRGLEVISDQGSNLMDFVQSYRRLLNVPAPDKKPTLVKRLVGNVSVLLKEMDSEGDLSLEVSIVPEDLSMFLDEKQMTQVLLNLCKNAMQAMEQQDQAKLYIEAGKRPEPYILIRDNGPGIAPEVLDEIFIPFFTTKAEGTGIGLSFSKQVLLQHGGRITVYSELGQGTEFRLILP